MSGIDTTTPATRKAKVLLELFAPAPTSIELLDAIQAGGNLG